MNALKKSIEAVLPYVQTPAQYTGGEINSICKDASQVDVSFCLAFPDTYSIGMSHIGLKILYELINSKPNMAAERAFAPWIDMVEHMRSNNLPLYALESFRPVREFDVLGFSLQYELTFTNILLMLELAGIPLDSKDRTDADPIVIAGGPGAYNPEPIAGFIDVFLIGDAEESILEFAELVKTTKDLPRKERLLKISTELSGAYVPSLYEVTYNDDGTLKSFQPTSPELPKLIERRWVKDLNSAAYPVKPVVPYVDTVHDRYAVEIMRGCVNACRFCHAGTNYRPRRERSVEKILELIREGLKNTGYDEVALASLSTSDYTEFARLVKVFSEEFTPQGISLSLPSLHVDSMLKDVPESIKGVRKGALTMAPEVSSDRLRRSIRKRITNADLFAAARAAFEAGWETVKLYFMIGLPGETDEDVAGIASMANEVCYLRKKISNRPAKVNVSVSTFVPKANTPLQWAKMPLPDEIERRQAIIRDGIRSKRIKLGFNESHQSLLEGVFARGDRRLGEALKEAYKLGSVFDAWREGFDNAKWNVAFEAAGIAPSFYNHRERGNDELLPWSHISGGAKGVWLEKERENARCSLASDEDAPQEALDE